MFFHYVSKMKTQYGKLIHILDWLESIPLNSLTVHGDGTHKEHIQASAIPARLIPSSHISVALTAPSNLCWWS